MKKSVKAIMTAGFALLLSSSVSNCLLISDVIGVDPVGGIPVETVVRQAAGKAAQGWMFGCGAALETFKSDAAQSGVTINDSLDCLNNSVTNAGEPFALYATAARNAANNLIPVMKANSHAYYVESSLDACLNTAFTNAYLYTKIFLEKEVVFSPFNGLNEADMAASTYIGVQGTAACAEDLVGTGRIIAIDGVNL